MVVSLEKTGVQAWGVYPGGQSGNPGSRFYDNFLNHWATGQYFKLDFLSSQEQLKSNSIFTTTFKPASK
jgi:penicillin amidase